ncbi:hypothetical protein BVRB_9g204730 [Beta vulgaris subsp. vulgaris]|nr:hypothetical protein BVRB_9g204730 [Beta vulgaris subsp. vulgaris]
MPTERSPNRLNSDSGDKKEDKKHRQRLQDALPLELPPASDTKLEIKDASYMLDGKTNGQGETINQSDPTAVPRSENFFQHDDRRTAARDGRRSGRRLTSERGLWKDSKDEERTTHRTAYSDPKEREEKCRRQGGDNHIWRHDRFNDAEADAHPLTKKRRPFREEKLPMQSENVEKAAPEPSKVAHPASSTVRTGRWEERARDHRPLERNEQDRSRIRERSFSVRGRAENSGFSSRDRFNGADNDGKYKVRDKFGGRQGYRPNGTGTQAEKWKHDMFDEANRSPTSKNDEDPVAKVEALLAL